MPKEFVITNKLLSSVVDFYVLDTSIKHVPIAVDYKKELQTQNIIDNLHYISLILGQKVSSAQARKYVLGRNIPQEKEKDKKIVNIRNVIEFIRSNASDNQLSLQVILHINKLLTEGLVELWDVGRLRNSSERPITPNIYVSRNVLNTSDYYALINNSLNLLFGPDYGDVNFLIKIAVFSYYLLMEKPLASYNDITVIFLTYYLFLKSNISPLLSVGKVYYKYEEELKNAFESGDINLWVEVFLSGVSNELSSLEEIIKPRSLLKQDQKREKILDLNRRQIKILHYVAEKGEISRELSSRLNNTSIATAFRDLDFLCKKSFLKREGIGKGTHYIALQKVDI